MNIKKLSEYPMIEGFDLASSVLLQENNIKPEDFNKNFPDLREKYFSFRNIIPKFSVLKNTEKFINFIERNSNNMIVNISDYDCDGVMSAVIFNITLTKLGIKTGFIVPDRLNEGYGMNNELIDKAIEIGAKAIITSDNGISCKEQVDYALSKGLDVFITDHHIGTEGSVPEGVDIVDPCYNGDEFPAICGAFVVAKLCYSLLKKNSIDDQYLLNEIMTYAAIATITDFMPVLNENRLLLRCAYDYIDFIKSRNIWNRVMKIISGLGGYYYLHDENQMADETLFGFYIGPTINAISRIKGDPTGLIQNIIDCGEHDKYIDKTFSFINRDRKAYTKILYSMHQKTDDNMNIEVLNEEDFEFPISGLLGLMANNLVKIENKPSFIGTKRDGKYEFSCRTIPGYNIHDAYDRIKKILPGIGLDGGGHASAMGIRFDATNENLLAFREAFLEDFNNNKGSIQSNDVLFEIEPDILDGVISSMNAYYTYGNGFRKPKFIYTGKLESYDEGTRIAKIGDYLFKAIYLDYKIGDKITVGFDVEFNSKNGPYFRIDNDLFTVIQEERKSI